MVAERVTPYPVIDADGHVFDGEEVWQNYLDEQYRHRIKVFKPNDFPETEHFFFVDGDPIPPLFSIQGRFPMGAGTLVRHTGKKEGLPGIKDIYEGATDPQTRLKDMDREGRDVDILFPSIMLFLLSIRDAELAAAMCRAYNNWLADFCKANPDRLKAVAVVPFQDMQLAVEELKRVARELGVVGVMCPAAYYDKNLDDPVLYPFYDACQQLDLPLCLHVVAEIDADTKYPPGNERYNQFPLWHAWLKSISHMHALACVIGGRVLDEFPKLSFAFMETGVGWVPYWLDKLEENVETFRKELPNLTTPINKLKMLPREYLQTGRLYFECDCDEETLPFVAELIGEDKILYASDYPHFDARFPDSVRAISERETLSESAKRKILGENAARFYKLDYEAIKAKVGKRR